MFYSIPEGRGFGAEDVIQAEDRYHQKHGVRRPLVSFRKLETKILLDRREQGQIIDREDMKRILKDG